MQILDTIRLLVITVSYNHVKGHQDENPHEAVRLTQQAELNVACDFLATEPLARALLAPIATFLPASKVSVTIAGTTVTKKIPRMIRTLLG
jgi:hypothetical protein